MKSPILKFLSSALFLLACSVAIAAGLKGVTPDELSELQKQGAVVVDVRTPEEWKETGLIAGSKPMMYFDKNGQYDKTAWVKSLTDQLGSKDRPVVLVCRSGNRSRIVGSMLANELGFTQVYHLEKGIRAWKAESKDLIPGTGN